MTSLEKVGDLLALYRSMGLQKDAIVRKLKAQFGGARFQFKGSTLYVQFGDNAPQKVIGGIPTSAAATRILADVQDEQEAKSEIHRGRYKIVEGEGQRFWAVQFKNGRFGVVDSQRPGYSEPTPLATGLDEKDARRATKTANHDRKWHPALALKGW